MRAIGIDLGTTNSAAAIGGKEVKILPTASNELLTLSVVGYVRRKKSDAGEIVVGRQAANNAVRDPLNTIFSIKRLMGRVYGEDRVNEVQSRFSYQLAPPPEGDEADQSVRVLLNDKTYTPVELSSMILKSVKAGAELALAESVTHAVITVPAYFEERQRKATEEAGALAGLEVLEIIDEPTAAAIAFGIGRESERHRVLVYDLGGGTFDISIIQMTAGRYSVLEIGGDNWLGGDDFDLAIVSRMIEWVKEEYDHDPSQDKAFLTKAKVEAEKAKFALSVQQSAEILAPLMVNIPKLGPSDVEMDISRDQFEADIRPFVDRTTDLVRMAMERQNLNADDITEVLLVGGSTAVPLVQKSMHELFGQAKVKRHINPMECVALGAGILAASKPLGETEDVTTGTTGPTVQAVTAMHLGVRAVEGEEADTFVPIIEKGTPYPLREPKRRTFHPTDDNQTLIRVPVYEGLNKLASLNEQQGIIEFPLPEGIKLSDSVEVSFNFDSNRVLTVGIRVIGTDFVKEETLRRDRPRIKAVAQEQTMVDDWREDLQPSIRAAEHFREVYGQYIEADDRQELEEGLRQGKTAMENNDQITGTKATLLLRNKIIGSATASLLFMVERTMHGLSPEKTQILAQGVAMLRSAYAKGNHDEVDRLGGDLRLMMAQLMSSRAEVRTVEDRKDWNDMLRIR